MQLFKELHRRNVFRVAIGYIVSSWLLAQVADLGGHLSYSNFYGESDLEDIKRAEEILEILQGLAPDSVDHLIAQAYYSFYTLKDWDQAFEIISLAEDKAPSDLKILELKSIIMRRQGRNEERNEVLRKIQKLDPQNAETARKLVVYLMMTHNYKEARREIEKFRFETYGISYWRSMLELGEHRDYERYTTELIVLETEKGAGYNISFSSSERRTKMYPAHFF